MREHFADCLRRGKITPFSRGQHLAGKELRLAREDLTAAQTSFRQDNCRWSTVQTYYAMFHAARALLYAKNYREKSHFCLIEAIRALYVATGKLPVRHLEAMVQAKNLREAADYSGDFDHENTARLLLQAEGFLTAAETMVGK